MSIYSVRKQILLWLTVNTFGGPNDLDHGPELPNKSGRVSDHLTIKLVGLDSSKSWRHMEGTPVGGLPSTYTSSLSPPCDPLRKALKPCSDGSEQYAAANGR